VILGKKEIKAKEKSYILIGICEAKKRTLLSIGKYKKNTAHFSGLRVKKRKKKAQNSSQKSHTFGLDSFTDRHFHLGTVQNLD